MVVSLGGGSMLLSNDYFSSCLWIVTVSKIIPEGRVFLWISKSAQPPPAAIPHGYYSVELGVK